MSILEGKAGSRGALAAVPTPFANWQVQREPEASSLLVVLAAFLKSGCFLYKGGL